MNNLSVTKNTIIPGRFERTFSHLFFFVAIHETELNNSLKSLRFYSSIHLVVSLFFLGFSIMSYFFSKPALALYGTVCFTASTITSISLLMNKITEAGKRVQRITQCNLFTANILDASYFAIATFNVQDLVNDVRYTIICGFFFILYIFSILIGCRILTRVHRLSSESRESDQMDEEAI